MPGGEELKRLGHRRSQSELRERHSQSHQQPLEELARAHRVFYHQNAQSLLISSHHFFFLYLVPLGSAPSVNPPGSAVGPPSAGSRPAPFGPGVSSGTPCTTPPSRCRGRLSWRTR